VRNKFVALAQKRMNRAIKAIRLLGMLDRRSEFDAVDVEAMAQTLRREVDDVRGWLMKATQGEPDFQLGAPHDGGEG
jgi:hypothetical protein